MKKLLFFTLLYSTTFFSQNQATDKDAYVWFDNIIGQENLPISWGVKHTENYKTEKGQYPFLLSNDYFTSEIKYNGQVYYNIQIKYNVLEDELIAFIPSSIDKYPIVLLKNKVSHFYLNDKKFVRADKYGYGEFLSENEQGRLLKKYRKKKIEKTSSKGIYYKFKDRVNYLIFYKKESSVLSGRSDWVKMFPDKKKIIRGFYSKNRKLLKNNPDLFMTNLFQLLTQ